MTQSKEVIEKTDKLVMLMNNMEHDVISQIVMRMPKEMF